MNSYKLTAYRIVPVVRIYKGKTQSEAVEKMGRWMDRRTEERGDEFQLGMRIELAEHDS